MLPAPMMRYSKSEDMVRPSGRLPRLIRVPCAARLLDAPDPQWYYRATSQGAHLMAKKSIERLHATVFGRVQGVSFRFYTRDTATELDLTGWVANRYDGNVEVVAE